MCTFLFNLCDSCLANKSNIEHPSHHTFCKAPLKLNLAKQQISDLSVSFFGDHFPLISLSFLCMLIFFDYSAAPLEYRRCTYSCDSCQESIVSIRWVCYECPFSYDLCNNCYVNNSHKHFDDHDFVKVEPQDVVARQGENIYIFWNLYGDNINQVSCSIRECNSSKKSIIKDFLDNWRHSDKPKPTVISVLEVDSPNLKLRHEQYKKDICNKKMHLKNGNTIREFHGTTLSCELHITQEPCLNSTCNVCGILKSGFLIDKIGGGALGGWMRFGKGFYFTGTSSKAHDYSVNTEKYLGKGMRAVIVVDVVAGDQEKRKKNDKSPVRGGYDSIQGVVGTDLNYDELVVAKEDAALPVYVIIYSSS